VKYLFLIHAIKPAHIPLKYVEKTWDLRKWYRALLFLATWFRSRFCSSSPHCHTCFASNCPEVCMFVCKCSALGPHCSASPRQPPKLSLCSSPHCWPAVILTVPQKLTCCRLGPQLMALVGDGGNSRRWGLDGGSRSLGAFLCICPWLLACSLFAS
jgi:hypothetical protein